MIGALLLMAASAKAGIFMPPKYLQRQDVEHYINCIAKYRETEARAILLQKEHIGPKIFFTLIWGNCYPLSWVQQGKSSIQLNDYYFAGKLAESLIDDRKFLATPQDVGRGVSYGPPSFFDSQDQDDADAEKIRVAMDCAVKADAQSAHDVLVKHGSAGEEALARLSSAASACDNGELIGRMPVDAQRTAVALSYYRLGMAAVEASGS
jgi:hypothetical protein